jgi:cell division protein FtsL
MAAAAQARRAAVAAPRHREQGGRELAPPTARRAAQQRHRVALRSGIMRAFVVFVVCLTVLAVGRVALSFAVVQKSLQTDAVVRQERQVSADNAQLAEEVAQLASTVRISHIAQTQLGLVDPTHVEYLRVATGQTFARVAERP